MSFPSLRVERKFQFPNVLKFLGFLAGQPGPWLPQAPHASEQVNKAGTEDGPVLLLQLSALNCETQWLG